MAAGALPGYCQASFSRRRADEGDREETGAYLCAHLVCHAKPLMLLPVPEPWVLLDGVSVQFGDTVNCRVNVELPVGSSVGLQVTAIHQRLSELHQLDNDAIKAVEGRQPC